MALLQTAFWITNAYGIHQTVYLIHVQLITLIACVRQTTNVSGVAKLAQQIHAIKTQKKNHAQIIKHAIGLEASVTPTLAPKYLTKTYAQLIKLANGAIANVKSHAQRDLNRLIACWTTNAFGQVQVVYSMLAKPKHQTQTA